MKIPKSAERELNRQGIFKRDDGKWYSINESGHWQRRMILPSMYRRKRSKRNVGLGDTGTSPSSDSVARA